MHRFTRSHRCSAALTLSLVAIAGSAHAVGTKTVYRTPPAAGATTGVGMAPPTVPATTKYKDKGLKHATGRSGSASTDVRALLDKAGKTTLEITTGDLDSTAPAPGNLEKIQLKAFSGTGELRFTRNLKPAGGDGYEKLTLADLGRGQKVQVQTNVTGIDGNRTDVVTVTEQVKLRPDLKVDTFQAPERAVVGSGVNLTAVVREVNQDVGARADCVLYVDGTAVDRATGIWVDAGGSVSCAFNHTFTSVGTKQLKVAVEHAVPGDWDASNDVAADKIEIVDPVKPLGYYAYLQDYDISYDYKYAGYYKVDGAYASTGDWSSEYSQKGWVQYAYLGAWQQGVFAFPLKKVEATFASGGTNIDIVSLTDVPADWGWTYDDGTNRYDYKCAYRYAAAEASHVYVCSQDYSWYGTKYQWASAWYYRYAGDVTYYSAGYSDYWSLGWGSTRYSYNYTGSYAQGTRVKLGSTATLSISITDENATYRAAPEMTLTPLEWKASAPYSCSEYSYADYSSRYCWGYDYEYRGAQGYAYKPQ